jgi:hypothetical protein
LAYIASSATQTGENARNVATPMDRFIGKGRESTLTGRSSGPLLTRFGLLACPSSTWDLVSVARAAGALAYTSTG